jgi:uncharacterized membrane protein
MSRWCRGGSPDAAQPAGDPPAGEPVAHRPGDLGGLLLLAGTTAVTNSELLLRLYPAAVNLGMLLLFAGSLLVPPSMVERFARLGEPDLARGGHRLYARVDPALVRLLRRQRTAAAYTALFSSRDNWALYNGFIAYLLMGTLFAGEWLYRRCSSCESTG